MTTVNAVLVANYAIYYENRKLWEAKGDVVITKHDGTRLYTQQLFWNSLTKRIYSNVDTRLVTDTDEVIGEGFESDEEMNEPRFRRWKGKMQVDTEQLRSDTKGDTKGDTKSDTKSRNSVTKVQPQPRPNAQPQKGGVTKTKRVQTAPIERGAGSKRAPMQVSAKDNIEQFDLHESKLHNSKIEVSNGGVQKR